MVTVDMSNFKAQLEELERLNKERTQGEWQRQGRVVGQYGVVITGERGPRAWKPGRLICSSRAVKNGLEAANFKNNFEFIAASANITTPMIEHIRALEGENARLREALEDAHEALTNALDDARHLQENRCIPTQEEVNRLGDAELSARRALRELRGEG